MRPVLAAAAAIVASLALANPALAEPGNGARVAQDAPAPANSVTEWNLKLRPVLAANGAAEGVRLAAVLGMVHIAMHDALNSIDKRYEPYAYLTYSPNASAEAAVSGAARGVLIRMFPASTTSIEAIYAEMMALIPDSDAKTAGAALGDAAAAAIVARRQGDPLFAPTRPTYQWPPAGPGVHQPTPPAYSLAQTPYYIIFGKPFTLSSVSQMRPKGPPALTSNRWAKDYNEVKSIGRKNSAVRTEDQTQAVHFFAEPSPVVLMGRLGIQAVQAKELDLWESARALALLNMGLADSTMALFDSKYYFNFWRPVTAIHQGDTDGNAKTAVDESWESEIPTSNFPEYLAGHAMGCSLGSHILEKVLDDDNFAFVAESPTAIAGPRSYASFDAFTRECGNSHIWAGLQYRTTVKHSYRAGKRIARHTVHNFLRTAKP